MKKGEAVQLDTADAQSAAEELAEILDSMGQSLSGIAQWDMSGVIESLDMLGEKISALSEELGMLQISDSTLGSFTEITNVFASLLAMLQAVCSDEKVVELFSVLGTFLTQTLIPVLKGVFDWVGAIFGGTSLGMIAAIAAAIVLVVVVITRSLDTIKARFSEIWENHIKPMWDGICEFISSVSESLTIIWKTVLEPIVSWIISILEPIILTVIYGVIGALEVVLNTINFVFNGVLDVFGGVIDFIAGLFSKDWAMACDGLAKIGLGVLEVIAGGIKLIINGIIWCVNLFVGALYSVIAGVVNIIGGIIGVVGSLLGENWGFAAPTNPPQIPYLAKGAVLPANKPFLAMVGDQRHGTNVEAPLTTIQEAVALAMEDQFAGMMAGFEASVAVQKQILQAVLGIEIGDSTIGQAAARYNRKMAIIKGGM